MYRAIQDNVATSTSLNQLSHLGERLYWRLLSRTDSWGRLPGELVKIRALAVPRLALSDSELTEALEELAAAGRINIYCVAGVWACQLLDFDSNQPVANLRRASSRWPAAPTENPCKNGGSTDSSRQKLDTELDLNGSPRTVVQYAELPDSNLETAEERGPGERIWFHNVDLVEVARTLRGADQTTAKRLAVALTGMPEGALVRALESLEKRRGKQPPAESEARYLVGTLSTMRREGQYAS